MQSGPDVILEHSKDDDDGFTVKINIKTMKAVWARLVQARTWLRMQTLRALESRSTLQRPPKGTSWSRATRSWKLGFLKIWAV